jgi:ATP-dependent protease ClpP protease subunit
MHLYDFIKNNKYSINTYIDGFAASGGSVLFLAGKKRYMS